MENELHHKANLLRNSVTPPRSRVNNLNSFLTLCAGWLMKTAQKNKQGLFERVDPPKLLVQAVLGG